MDIGERTKDSKRRIGIVVYQVKQPPAMLAFVKGAGLCPGFSLESSYLPMAWEGSRIWPKPLCPASYLGNLEEAPVSDLA